MKEGFKKAAFDRNLLGVHDVAVEDHLRQTGQVGLPQAGILIDALGHLQNENLVEAYLRGSFASGEADQHSDIDLFAVVEPENLAKTYQSFHDNLNKNYPILVSCHDRLVKDYGGIGFMMLCEGDEGRLFQFDLYMAMKGVPPKVGLFSCPRVYASDPAYCWIEENQPNSNLPESALRSSESHPGGGGGGKIK
jgi:predicted nucleotidyltransferase